MLLAKKVGVKWTSLPSLPATGAKDGTKLNYIRAEIAVTGAVRTTGPQQDIVPSPTPQRKEMEMKAEKMSRVRHLQTGAFLIRNSIKTQQSFSFVRIHFTVGPSTGCCVSSLREWAEQGECTFFRLLLNILDSGMGLCLIMVKVSGS